MAILKMSDVLQLLISDSDKDKAVKVRCKNSKICQGELSAWLQDVMAD